MNGDGEWKGNGLHFHVVFGWQVQSATAAGEIEPLPGRLVGACGTASEEGEWV